MTRAFHCITLAGLSIALSGCGALPVLLSAASAIGSVGGAVIMLTNENTALINQYKAIEAAKSCPLPSQLPK